MSEWEEFAAYAPMIKRAKAEAWEHARRKLRAIPHWWNTEDQYGEFDLQPLGPDKTSEQGAFMHVKQIMDNNPYRQGEKIVLSNNDYDQLRKALDEE